MVVRSHSHMQRGHSIIAQLKHKEVQGEKNPYNWEVNLKIVVLQISPKPMFSLSLD